eukprot:g17435.t1
MNEWDLLLSLHSHRVHQYSHSCLNCGGARFLLEEGVALVDTNIGRITFVDEDFGSTIVGFEEDFLFFLLLKKRLKIFNDTSSGCIISLIPNADEEAWYRSSLSS